MGQQKDGALRRWSRHKRSGFAGILAGRGLGYGCLTWLFPVRENLLRGRQSCGLGRMVPILIASRGVDQKEDGATM